jgi:TatD DNase family protein
VAVGETLADAEANLALAARFPGRVLPAAGLFPTILDVAQADILIDWIRAHRGEIVAVGEVGLDHWKVPEGGEREVQREIFGRFVDLAVDLDLPLNVHSRAAGRATIELLVERGARRVQMHAFDGRAANALPGVEAGFYFSVPPSIVRSQQKQKLVRRLPLSSLLLETDSPVLGVDPGERNEPARVARSLAAIAELRGDPVAAVREAVAANTERLYRFGEPPPSRGQSVRAPESP